MIVSSSQPNKHIVPTHLNLPDQVLTVWSFSLTARQLLLVLVGGGLAGDLWQSLHLFTSLALPGQVFRGGLALLPLIIACFCAWYRYHGRYLEVWAMVLARYRLHPRCYVWRSIRVLPAPSRRLHLQQTEGDAAVAPGFTKFIAVSTAALQPAPKREKTALIHPRQNRLDREVV